LDFQPIPRRQLPAGPSSPAPPSPALQGMPFFPYAGVDPGNAGADGGMVAAFEQGFVGPTRLAQLESVPPSTSGASIWAVTPQGYIAQFSNGVMQSITLGTITGAVDSAASLSFGSAGNPLTQNLVNAFLANQQ